MSTLTHTGKRTTRRVATFAAGALVASAALVGSSLPASADSQYAKGPNPTQSSIEARTGSFKTDDVKISSLSARGFGGGTIWYPTDTSKGTFGGVAISPGFTAGESTIDWLGPRIASQGFVVITIDTNSRFDQPGSRAKQLKAALDQMVAHDAVRDRVDPNRLAVMGHSMGGGGSLELSETDSRIKASVPLTPWHMSNRFNTSVPTLIVAAQLDAIAPIAMHAQPQYRGLPSSTPRVYLEQRGASHLAPNVPDTVIAKYSIAWLKRWVDQDTRYSQFFTGGENRGDNLSDWKTGGNI